jgi:hypothetical protein
VTVSRPPPIRESGFVPGDDGASPFFPAAAVRMARELRNLLPIGARIAARRLRFAGASALCECAASHMRYEDRNRERKRADRGIKFSARKTIRFRLRS